MARTLVRPSIELPDPMSMRGRWAAFAAVCAARGWGDSCRADGTVWHFDDSGGNWADLHHVGDGRAVLIGNDHEYSQTYYAEAAEYFGEDETDLLAGAPDWWAPPVVQARRSEEWVGFVYGFDRNGWQRAPYDLEDGFGSVGMPAISLEDTRDSILEYAKDAPGLDGGPPRAAVDALIAADGAVNQALVAAVVGSTGWDAAAGVAAARAFLTA